MDNVINSIDKQKTKKINIYHLYTCILISSPILSLYGIGISTITIIDILLLAINVFFIFRIFVDGKIKVFANLVPYLLYIVVLSIVIMVDVNSIMRTLRYVFYLINIIFYTKKYFDFVIGVKIYRFISLVSTSFLFVQIIIYKLLGVYLPGVVLSANLVASDLYNYHLVFQNAQYKRFMSFFAEPSHYAIYILGNITIILFSKIRFSDFRKKDVLEFAYLSIGIALSTSILGIMVLSAMTLIWFIFVLFNREKNYKKLGLFVLSALVLVILVQNTNAFEYFTNSSVINRQADGRFGGYTIFRANEAETSLILFGRGMVGMPNINSSGFLASFPLLYYYFGIIGLILFLVSFIPYILRFKMNVSKGLIICLFGIALGSELILGIFILVFLPLIIKGNGET